MQRVHEKRKIILMILPVKIHNIMRQCAIITTQKIDDCGWIRGGYLLYLFSFYTVALCGMGATQSWVTELCHCLTQVCRKRRLEKGWTNGTSVTRSSSRCEGFVSGSHIFFIVNETLKQNLQSCESLNDLKCVDGTINPIQFSVAVGGP